MTIEETVAFLRTNRQRVDDLLSSAKLTRVKDASINGRRGRTLIATAQVLDHLAGLPNGPGRWRPQHEIDELLNSARQLNASARAATA